MHSHSKKGQSEPSVTGGPQMATSSCWTLRARKDRRWAPITPQALEPAEGSHLLIPSPVLQSSFFLGKVEGGHLGPSSSYGSPGLPRQYGPSIVPKSMLFTLLDMAGGRQSSNSLEHFPLAQKTSSTWGKPVQVLKTKRDKGTEMPSSRQE